MRIRRGWTDAHLHLSVTPPDLVSSVAQTPHPWLGKHHSPPTMLTKINLSVSSILQNSRSIDEEKSSSSSSSGTPTASSVSSFFSQHGRWCEEEKVFPLKKRKASLERFMIQESEAKDEKETASLMMRCTRKNGMGWRCSKQSAKGYAFCDYHINQSRRWRCHQNISKPNSSMKKLDNGGNGFRFGKKRQRMMKMSHILNRTMPMPAANAHTLC